MLDLRNEASKLFELADKFRQLSYGIVTGGNETVINYHVMAEHIKDAKAMADKASSQSVQCLLALRQAYEGRVPDNAEAPNKQNS